MVNSTRNLIHLVEQCFRGDGWLVAQGFNHEPEQLRYALDVSKWLLGDTEQAALMEAETGIGKTLGYLIPLMLHISMTGQRGMVATHTVQLQNQIMRDGDIDMAISYLCDCDLTVPRIQQVIGAHHYLDPQKAQDLISASATDEDRDMYFDAIKKCMNEDGLVETFISTCGDLPEGIKPEHLSIPSGESDLNERYDQNKTDAYDADIIITSHAMSIIDSIRELFTRDGLKPIEYTIIDEADAFENSAESFSSKKIWPKRISRLLSALDSELSPKKRETAKSISELANHIDALIKTHCSKKRDRKVVLFQDNEQFKFEVELAIGGILRDQKTVTSFLKKKSHKFDSKKLDLFNALMEHIRFLDSFLDNSFGYFGASISQIKGIPALEIRNPSPASIINCRLSKKDGPDSRILLTSATLSDGSTGQFSAIRGSLAIRRGLISDGDRYTPKDFGEMSFVLADPSVPKPFSVEFDEKEQLTVELNEEWLSYTANAIRKAKEQGPTLVLTSSFEETRQLSKFINDESVIIHQAGQSLKEKIANFQEKKTALVTPSAWEGVSIRDLDGEQLFKNLVITRMPISPSDPFKEEMIIHHRKLKNPSLSLKQIQGWLWVAREDKAIRKTRQGIGRLLRKKTDEGCVWICDPRFPLPIESARQVYNYKRVVPLRFVDSYNEAGIFLQNNDLTPVTSITKVDVDLEEVLACL